MNHIVSVNMENRTVARRFASRGFTLIELMVAVGVVAILAAIAVPTYTSAMVKGRRSDAESTLMDIAQRQQQYFLDARGYAPNAAALNYTMPVAVSPFYTIAIVSAAGNPPTFTATATPIPGTQQASDVTLTIDNTGAKTPSSVW
jgi:type IV pilus assembly protein PilE